MLSGEAANSNFIVFGFAWYDVIRLLLVYICSVVNYEMYCFVLKQSCKPNKMVMVYYTTSNVSYMVAVSLRNTKYQEKTCCDRRTSSHNVVSPSNKMSGNVPITFVIFIKHMLDNLLFMLYTFKADIRTRKNLKQRNNFERMSLIFVILLSIYCWK